ncbi:HFL202Cp [Eremothecium sinecaudum]|uniref:Kinesin-like protein n=1 Tax=Eremothecium sinecaudum TaxID=45286 RepID=A0A0X8HUH5_9SACH|nr:HFL202Cp [Eremothecium sinecaudum]AMD21654.1 HFL202Cp [Eremothecium sinecaudum]
MKIAIRIRDKLPREESLPSVIKSYSNVDVTLFKENNTNAITTVEPTFQFDQVFGEKTTQKQIYNALGREYVLRALEGYHTCIMTYGQTGSGKTYTMLGTEKELGLTPRVSLELFNAINMCQDSESEDGVSVDFKVTVSYFQIYNEQAIDLLSDEQTVLKVRDGPRKITFIEGLSEHSVETCDELLAFLDKGSALRSVGSTFINEKSSRSHAIFTINIQQTETDAFGDKIERISSIKLVDLAGSERAKVSKTSDDRFKEGKNINKSLMTLGRVIQMLSRKNRPMGVAYRESLLTRVLRENLDGNSITCILACISPCEYEESLSTLRYASTAKLVKTEARVNATHISKGEEHLFSLQNQLHDLQTTLNLQTARLENQRVLEEQIEKINETNRYLQRRLEQENKVCTNLRNRWSKICWESRQLGSALLQIASASEAVSTPLGFQWELVSLQQDCAKFKTALQSDKQHIRNILDKYSLL